ncbi:phosphotransferase [Phycicoccus endophyticus]|uniref:Phosphotransferase n=1 Tax=Phycicoccus endophyticus TaxID=1690220 RepID=A0A7G9QZA0_9MICO|nr:phosphotransferase [Phycicoccus endophyticus]NHI19028.1 phosphotransferase [Phycicoccus endophyticus]QNN48675.1 phosphotransferase [Phycicoccus endophyticus]GGL32282.1 phosphotransferase [Phycicoccus endophyticus]
MRDLPALWRSDGWRAGLEAWLRPALEAAGRTPTGPLVQERIRFWSTVLRVDTDGGTVWVKENAPSQAFEAGLVSRAARLSPQRLPPVLAVDTTRGWLATADLGAPLGAGADLSESAWAELVAAWGDLQRTLVPHADAVLASGVPPMPEEEAPDWAAAFAEELAGLPREDPRRLEDAERRHVEGGLAMLGRAADELVASGLPATLQHNDLHLDNALRAPGGSMAFIDLGDAVWAHPLTALRAPLWALEARGRGSVAAPERVLDAALEPWTDHLPRRGLRALLPAADRVSALHRSVSWRRLLDDVPLAAVDPAHRRAAVSWLLVATAADPAGQAASA